MKNFLIPIFKLSQPPLQHDAGSPTYPIPRADSTPPMSVGALRLLTAARQEQGTLPGKADYSPRLELIRACLN